MISVTLSEFRAQQSEYIAAAQREPVEISSRGVGRPQHRATHSSCYRRISD
ncbi:type II toxin-antitoxin system prevent-host-death family antitoxin [Pseudoclavibacter soli]|uniref:type II toxin-antitoxin system prevent-host-death family antitoxin n=1 Tax=Pseudoclavibacter soli TaxID=452623 RepID=UPI0012EC24B9|nr:type II toxin-antitoxin system prevent-host-death family antitoxin [Pseudoclavibacter soli]